MLILAKQFIQMENLFKNLLVKIKHKKVNLNADRSDKTQKL